MTSNFSTEDRLAFLDSLRGIAAIWVVFYHVIYMPAPNLEAPEWARPWASIGGVGVTLFFLVSAFSLCYTMPFHAKAPQPLRSFYVRRLLRIAPLLYVMLAVTLVRDVVVWRATHSPADIAENLLFVFNLVPGKQTGIVWASWTIGVEMLFYLMFPVFYIWSRGIVRATIFFLGAVALSLAFKRLLDYYSAGTSDFFQLSVIRHLPVFASGIVAFQFYERFALGKNIVKSLALFAVSLGLFVAAAMMLNLLFGDPYYFQIPWFVATLLGLAFFPFSFLVNRLTGFLGKLSYSLYLIHPPLVVALIPLYRRLYGWDMPLSAKYLMVVTLTFGLLILLAYPAYRYVEQPGIRLGKRLARRSRSPSISPAGAAAR
jgi:peptidoglycan/LPS O-acetylase OafA/YrhL